MKIVVCGPPHSGKSVFVQQLRRLLLPLGVVGIIEGCPDGEGGWAGATEQNLVATIRRKGNFTIEFVDWVIASVKGSKMPITLVDVGGIRSPENKRIFRECDGYIVLANPAMTGELEAWDAFGKANECKPVALLESILHGETSLASEQEDGVIRGIQASLERGKLVAGPVLNALVAKLLTLAGCKAKPGEIDATIHTGRLADNLDIPTESRDARLGFRPHHASLIYKLSQERLIESTTRLWGACPSWLAALVASEATGMAELWDIRLGWVNIPKLALASNGSAHLTWRVEKDTGHTIVSFTIPGQVFDQSRLHEVVVPIVESEATVVISGRGPHWLVAAIARAYAKAGHAIAVIALPETNELMADRRTWGEANPGFAPAVMVTGKKAGQIVSVPIELIQ